MQYSVNISDNILQWIMEQVQLDTLPDKVAKNLTMWCRKEKTPTFNQVEDASRATGIPLGYFFLTTPPQEDVPLVEYRTVDSAAYTKPSRELIDTIHDMEMIQDWTRQNLIAEDMSELPFVGRLQGERDVKRFAQSMRELLELDVDWYTASKGAAASFKRLRAAMSEIGVIVMTSGIVRNNTRRSLDIEEFRAFAMEDPFAPLVFINGNDSKSAKLFSLLHEFAHLCMGENSLYNEGSQLERERRVSPSETMCNAAAAEILVPDAYFTQAWQREIQNGEDEDVIFALAREFKCGLTVIARRALDHGFIDRRLYMKMANLSIEQYNKEKARRKEHGGGTYYATAANRMDVRFLRMLAGSVAAGTTTYTEAFRLTSTNRFTFAKLIEYMEGGTN